jgi:hypothetical protein
MKELKFDFQKIQNFLEDISSEEKEEENKKEENKQLSFI